MEQSNSNASDDIEDVCAIHKGKKFTYCRTCKLFLCDECCPKHEKQGHKLKDAAAYAAKYREKILNHKEEFNKEVIAKVAWMQKYQQETENRTEKILLELENGMSSFLKLIREEAFIRSDGIRKNIAATVKALESEGSCSDYNPELETADKVVSGEDESQIILLKKEVLNEKYKIKKGQINGLLRMPERIKEKLQAFARDYKEISDIFQIWEHNSTLKLTEAYEKRLTEIQECEDKLYERHHQLWNQSQRNAQVYQENELLNDQKRELNNSILGLKNQIKDLNSTLELLQGKQKDIEQVILGLDQSVLTKKYEITNLDDAIKARQIALKELIDKKPGAVEVKQSGGMSFKEMELLLQSNFIFIFDQKPFTLHVYNFDTKKSMILKAAEYGISSNHDSVQIKDDLYVTGGFDTAKVRFSNSTLKISIINGSTIQKEIKSDMILPKSQHKMVMLDGVTLYSIGGKSKDKKFLSYCERYNVVQNKWEQAPALNEAKLNIAATTFSGLFIYTFGGFKGTFCHAIECLDISKPKKGWENVKVSNPGGWNARDEAGCFQLSDKEIMVFGGIGGTTGCTDEAFVLNVEKKVIDKHPKKLTRKEWFNMRTSVRLPGGLVCTAGYFTNDLHIYDTTKAIWSIVEEKEWKPAA